MSEIKGLKVTTQFVGLLLCISLISTAFAAGSVNTDDVWIGNVTNENTTIENKTVNSVSPFTYSTYLSAGSNTQFTATFSNQGNETLTLIPKVVATSNINNVDESWITISPANATVAPGSVQNFVVKINVPQDAESGYYQGTIAFTDDLIPNSIQYVNTMQLYISVQAQSKIELQTSYLSDTLGAGKEYEYKIKIKNIAAKDITIDPKLNVYNLDSERAIGDDTIEISAPSTIKAGEVTNMTIKVNVPQNSTGNYNGYIDMGVDGKVNDGYTPQISLYFNIWKQSKVPFTKTFNTTSKDPITIEISTNNYDSALGLRTSPKDESPSFNLGLICNSVPVNTTFMKSVESGSVNVGNNYPVWAMEKGEIYLDNGGSYAETYTAPGAIGNWTLTILPENTNNFGYSINIGNGNSAIKENETVNNTNVNNTNVNNTNVNNTNVNNTNVNNTTADNLTVALNRQINKIGTGHDPAIYGSKVTWVDTAGRIHIYDLTTKIDTKINSSNASHPAIYRNKLVWYDESNGTPRLTVYDILSGTRSYITQNVDQYSIPAIYGNRIVWSSSGNIYLRDISTSSQVQIAVGNSPDIYDNKVVYASSVEIPESDYQGIRLYDINTKKAITICSEGDANTPHIYGNKVIWSDHYTRLGYIRMYDISTNKMIDVTSDNAYSGDPNNPDAGDDTGYCNAIYGDKIVYAKVSNDQFGNAGIYVYSISKGKSTPMINYAAGIFTTQDIYRNTVAWGIKENISDGDSIYVCDLAAKPVASFAANKVSGTHSLPVTFTYIGTGGGNPNSYHWNFGDKTASNHALSATHTYTKAGKYTVSLTVKNAAGSNTTTKSNYITVK
jgi:beta propeller repeat protein